MRYLKEIAISSQSFRRKPPTTKKLNRKLTKIVDIAGKLDSGPLVEDEVLAGGEELRDHVGHLFSQSRPFARKIISIKKCKNPVIINISVGA